MIHHVYMEIETALDMSDRKLGKIFKGNGADIKKQLRERYAKGERLIGSVGCKGFDPITGCPGHPDENDKPVNV